MRAKLGIDATAEHDPGDRELADDWLRLLQRHHVDLTTAFRRLTDAADGALATRVGVTALFEDEISGWLGRWTARLAPDAGDSMRLANPIYVPRNHLVEAALTAAVSDGDLGPFDELLARVTDPYTPQPDSERFEQPAPDGFNRGYQTFCGT